MSFHHTTMALSHSHYSFSCKILFFYWKDFQMKDVLFPFIYFWIVSNFNPFYSLFPFIARKNIKEQVLFSDFHGGPEYFSLTRGHAICYQIILIAAAAVVASCASISLSIYPNSYKTNCSWHLCAPFFIAHLDFFFSDEI